MTPGTEWRKDALLTVITLVLLYGLFDSRVENKEIFSMLLMIVGYLIGRKERR